MSAKSPKSSAADTILGKHPTGDSFGAFTTSNDGHTTTNIAHRSLELIGNDGQKTVAQLRCALITHHADKEKIERIKIQLERLGFDNSKLQTCPIPKADKTRKGNLAEIFLAEYISASASADLPVYRLRYNPNVEQSMKGDDVLAFDFNHDPVKIFVGEAKFRETSSKKAVQDMVNALITSHKKGVPASLQFVADRLFEAGQIKLGQMVEDCAVRIANGDFDLSYVGLIMSKGKCKKHVDDHTPTSTQNLVVLSFVNDDITGFFQSCYENIEEDAFGTPS